MLIIMQIILFPIKIRFLQCIDFVALNHALSFAENTLSYKQKKLYTI